MSGFSNKYKFDEAQKKELASEIHVGDLVKVIAFDPQKMTVDVKPITQRLSGGEYATPSQVSRVPVVGTISGGYLFRPWIEPGDVGSVQYMDYDIDRALESGGESKPNTERNHSDSDAVFLGGLIAGSVSAPPLPDGLALATGDGSIYLVITKDQVLIQGDVSITGDLLVNGNITVTGGDVVADSISLKNHTHPGVQPGGDSTGKAQ